MKRILRMIAITIAVIALLVLLRTQLFALRCVEVTGGDAQTVCAASGAEAGAFLLALDKDALRAGVDSLGTLKLEDISIRLPGILRLRVQERERAAMLLCGEGIAVLDWECTVVELLDEAPDRDMLYLSGIEIEGAEPGKRIPAGEKGLFLCCAVLSAVRESGAGAYISEIDFSSAEQLTVIACDGTRVLLGDGTELTRKLIRMRAAVQDLLLRGEGGGTLDVSLAGRADYKPLQ